MKMKLENYIQFIQRNEITWIIPQFLIVLNFFFAYRDADQCHKEYLFEFWISNLEKTMSTMSFTFGSSISSNMSVYEITNSCKRPSLSNTNPISFHLCMLFT